MQLDWKQNAFWNNPYKGNLNYNVWEKSISWSKEVMRFLQRLPLKVAPHTFHHWGLVPNLEFSRENVKNICKNKYNFFSLKSEPQVRFILMFWVFLVLNVLKEQTSSWFSSEHWITSLFRRHFKVKNAMFNVQTLVKTGDRPDRRKVFYSNIWRFISSYPEFFCT
jgi:hypothetical protein